MTRFRTRYPCCFCVVIRGCPCILRTETGWRNLLLFVSRCEILIDHTKIKSINSICIFFIKKKNWKSYIAKEFFKIDWFSSYYYDVERWIEIKINLSIKRIFLLKYSAKFYTIAYTNFANDELSYLCIRDIWCSDKSKVTRAINLPAVIQDWYGAHIFGPIVYRAKWSKFFVLLFNRIINCNFF